MAEVDVAGFKFKTPPDSSDGAGFGALSFYFGWLGGNGTWNNSTKTASLQAALVEINSVLSAMVVYYDRDGTPGFQIDVTAAADILNCSSTNDCVDRGGVVDLRTLTWTPIALNTISCNTVMPNQGYHPNCVIYELTTNGTLPSCNQTVIEITARAASQPVIIDGVMHGPDRLKFDVAINVPWNNFTLMNASAAKIMLVFFHAGKAVDVSAVGTFDHGQGKSHLTFGAAGGRSSYFGYNASLDIDGNPSTVVTVNVTEQAITSYSGNNTILNQLKAEVLILEALGWVAALTFHSFTPVHPNHIDWDPEVGQQNATNVVQMPPSGGGSALAPGLALCALLAAWVA